ncbi:ABC transporter permease [Nocardioides alkalitolerans]|uniref:ABC transporter permease n=1 Tax=Nocardioides alkalitolerans TaxID=281714 RepID=UPI00041B25EB|nr:ABC transporter permease [Nocardioides alkalitolerans]
MTTTPEHAARRTARQTFTDAVPLRSVALVLGVLVLQLAFVASYVGAFHDPTPHEIEVGVVAPDTVAAQTVEQLNDIDGTPLAARVTTEADARAAIESGDLSAALVVSTDGTEDTLLVASGGGSAVATAVETVLAQAESTQGRTLATTDLVPLEGGDARGLTGFYLVVGWMVGGYLVASLLGVAQGSRPATPRRAAIRLAALVPYAVASGLGGALVVGPWLGALEGPVWLLTAIGALVVLAAAAMTVALQVLLGTVGIAVAILLFVVIGNPSAGGAIPAALLPTFWRTVGPWLPNGAATEAVRGAVYFDAAGIGGPLLVIAAWAVAGIVVTMVASWLLHRRTDGAAARAGLATP